MIVHPPGLGLLAAYRAQVDQGTLAADPSQLAMAERLQRLSVELDGYTRLPVERRKKAFARAIGRLNRAKETPAALQGLYLVGAVGRGKSMLMDLFFDTVKVAPKRRLHFHEFIQETHRRIHKWKQANPNGVDPIPPLAAAIADEATLLCFDEFQVNDIVDAMLLGRLFESLFKLGVIVVATSNIEPIDLFKGKPGRDAFAPFIDILSANLEVVLMDDGRDFRRGRQSVASAWNVPADRRAEMVLDRMFLALTNGSSPIAETILVMGRKVSVPITAAGVARFDFQQLCATPLGAGDFLALARRYHTILIDGIPRLKPANHDEARRFIVLIDALYDHRVKLVASADAMPGELYAAGEGAEAFGRTASRLEEMISPAYQSEAHLA